MRIILAAFLFAFASLAHGVGMPVGLGNSSYTCLDIDGDGYGVGPGCTGPDADDNDAAVHTGAAAIAAHGGTLASFLSYKGYSPLRYWYLAPSTASPAGNDSTCAVNDVTKPCLTYTSIQASVVPGDAVIMRNGWNGTLNPPNGTAANPVLIMSYPGELAVISDTGNPATGYRIRMTDRSYVIFDGMQTVEFANITGGTSTGQTSSTFHDNTFRHIETVGEGPGALGGLSAFDGLQNILVEYNVFHDSAFYGSGGQHCLYLGSRGLISSNVTIRRNICFNTGTQGNGFHLNGRMANTLVEDNVLYNLGISGISLQEGVNNSIIRRNLVFAAYNSGIEFSNYPANQNPDGSCGGATGEICPYDQTNNTIEFNTVYAADHQWNTGAATNGRGITVAYNYSINQVGDLGHNTFRKNIIVTNNNTYATMSTLYPSGTSSSVPLGYLSTDTFTDNIYWIKTGNGTNVLLLSDQSQTPSTLILYTCTTAATVTTISGCTFADPLFTNTSGTYLTPTTFDFKLQAGSPATGYGAIGTPVGDTTPPVVAFTTPTNGATTGCLCQFTTSASDDSGAAGITQRLYIDGVLYATQTGAVLSHRRRLTRGSHTVWVTATDAASNSSTATITITVQ